MTPPRETSAAFKFGRALARLANGRIELTSEGAAQTKPSIAAELERLAELRDRGVLNDREFENEKSRLLAPPPSVADELEKLASLRLTGDLTDEEFQVQKLRLMDGGPASATEPPPPIAESLNERSILIRQPLDAATERLLPVLEHMGRLKVVTTASGITASGKWLPPDPLPALRYKVTLSSDTTEMSLAEFTSRSDTQLRQMLDQVLARLNPAAPGS